MIRLLKHIASKPSSAIQNPPNGRLLKLQSTFRGLISRGLLTTSEVGGVTVFVPTDVGRQELKAAAP